VLAVIPAQGHSAGARSPRSFPSPTAKMARPARSDPRLRRPGQPVDAARRAHQAVSRAGPPRWRGRRRPAGRQGVEALAGVAQVQQGKSTGQEGYRRGRTEVAVRRRGGGGSAGQRCSGVDGKRLWSAKVVVDAWSSGKRRGSEERRQFGWEKPGEAELTVRPRWQQWRLSIDGVARCPMPERGLMSLQRVQGG
jgi:hypothetical protein